MMRLAVLLIASLWAAAASAESFITVRPEPKSEAWWLRAEFHALHTKVRGIPVQRIRADWCKATEFTRALFPASLLVENGTDLLRQANLSFSVDGAFDGADATQTALVGVYQTCRGVKGRFLLLIDKGTRRVRFLHTDIARNQFSALTTHGRQVVVVYCLECDNGATVRWSRARKRFVLR